MNVRQDERLGDRAAGGVPMTPVECVRCGAGVLVRKSSWEQTSIQWESASRARCLTPPDNEYETCPSLRESIGRAALDGRLPVLED